MNFLTEYISIGISKKLIGEMIENPQSLIITDSSTYTRRDVTGYMIENTFLDLHTLFIYKSQVSIYNSTIININIWREIDDEVEFLRNELYQAVTVNSDNTTGVVTEICTLNDALKFRVISWNEGDIELEMLRDLCRGLSYDGVVSCFLPIEVELDDIFVYRESLPNTYQKSLELKENEEVII